MRRSGKRRREGKKKDMGKGHAGRERREKR